MKFKQYLFFCIALLSVTSVNHLNAQLKLPPVISDHMVLQRDIAIPIWGSASANAHVEILMDTVEVETNADEEGNWKVDFPPMNAGGPHKLIIKSNSQQIRLEDIYIGEVWVCSGQSNMEWPLRNTRKGDTEIDKATFPMIRLFHYKKKHDTYKTPYSAEELESFSKGDFFYESKWALCNPETAKDFSAVGYYFGKKLHEVLDVPIGLIQVAVGGSPCQSWISEEGLASHPQLEHLVEDKSLWIESEIIHPWLAERAQQNWEHWDKTDSEMLPGHPFAPHYLFDAAINPLAPYAISGTIWYQGESNATHPNSYPAMMEQLLKSWRSIWNQGDFPFYFVQLPRIGNRNLWAEFREAQEQSLSISNTGMVVAIDQGHPTDVHPREKEVIGFRLADLALAKTYQQDIKAESPMMSAYNWKVAKRQIVLQIKNTYDGLRLSDKDSTKGFYLQGYLRHGSVETIIRPEKVLIENNQIVLTYSEDLLPVKVKYAWASYPDNNVVNSSGLPLAPFKIDLEGVN